jgi:3-deoxy-7-phosphoheptulonate synthase
VDTTAQAWSPNSWRSLPAAQQPSYESQTAVQEAGAELACLPPLVTVWEIEELRRQIADAAIGKRFLLQGGDCAESFGDCSAATITNKLKVLLQMSLVLVHGTKKPVVRVGRFAGHYAKPRSSNTETRAGVTLPAYRGDMVNGPDFTQEARRPDPRRMLRAYERSALTLNYTRGLARSGFADLHHPENWNLAFLPGSELAQEYTRIVNSVRDSMQFMENVLGVHSETLNRVEIYTSHEALLLPYEEAQTRQGRGAWYNLSTHMPWIGARTVSREGAHVEYMRGISNPIGVKVSASLKADELLRLLDVLDAARDPGRITLIHRMGHSQIAEALPPLIRAVRRDGRFVLWACDPMHGNTRQLADGTKTRYFSEILSELEQAFELHQSHGSLLGGVHFELAGEGVTECIGGSSRVDESDLKRAYRSEVDPRLNDEQALEMAMLIAHKLQKAA